MLIQDFFSQIVPLHVCFFSEYLFFFLCSPNQNSSQTLWAHYHHWASQMTLHPKPAVIWQKQHFLLSDDEYFTASCMNSLFYQIRGWRRNGPPLTGGGVGDVGTEEEEKVHFLHPKTPNVSIPSRQVWNRSPVTFKSFRSEGGTKQQMVGISSKQERSASYDEREGKLRDGEVWKKRGFALEILRRRPPAGFPNETSLH